MGKHTLLMRVLGAALAISLAAPVVAEDDMLIIAHRGASGERPEHTLASYERAIDQGADYIEPDLVVTSDGVLIARHENEISETTDVAGREEFADRNRSKTIDGRLVTGWFAEDFTLAELKTLRARERLPSLRPANARFDGLYDVPTFADIVTLVRAKEAETGRRIGIYPELKHPGFLLQDVGIDVVDLLVVALREAGYTSANDPVFVQCFEVEPLRRLNQRIELPLVQLIAFDGGPADEPDMRYAEMITPSGLADIATYADAIGADTRLLLNDDLQATPVVAAAHDAGLRVHGWTLRKENVFLPSSLRSGGGDGARGDYAAAWSALEKAGLDGVFTDDPALAAQAKRAETM